MALEVQVPSWGEPLNVHPLHELTRAVAAASQPEEVYQAALLCLRDSLGVEQSSILLFDPDSVLRFKAWRGLSDAYRTAVEGHSPWTPETPDPQPVLVPDVAAEPSLAGLKEVIEAEGIEALAFIPLAIGDKLLGKFMLHYPAPHDFSSEEVLLAQTIAAQVAFTIDHQASLELHEQMEAMLHSTVTGIVQIDTHGRILMVNDRFCEIVGRPREELLDSTTANITHPDDLDATRLGLQLLEEGADHFTIEKRYVRPDGSIVWTSKSFSAIRDELGGTKGAIAVVTDITEQKLADAVIRESEQRYRDLVAALGLAVYTTDAEGRITLYNEAAVALWGREPELGKDLWCGSWRIYTPDGDDMPFDQCPMAIALKEDRPIRGVEIVVERPDGSRSSILTHPTPLHDSSGVLIGAVNVLVDITARKEAEIALQESKDQTAKDLAATQQLQEISTRLIQEEDVEALYGHILDAAAAIMRSDMASMQIIDEGRDALRMLAWRGFDPDFGKIFEFNDPDTKTSCSVARGVGHRVVVPDVETCDFIVGTSALEDHRKTGIRAVQSTPLFSRGGKLLGMISTHWRQPHEPMEQELRLLDVLARQAADLLERKQADEAAIWLSALVQSSDDAVVGKDLNGVIQSWNAGAKRIFGYTAEEAIGQSIRLIIPPERQHEEDEVLSRVRSGERVDHFETVRRRKDGTLIDISVTISPVKDRNGRVIGASKVARDISEQKAIEEALRRSMALKDQFLGLVSHELRTPISTILGNALLLSRRGDRLDEADKRQAMEDITAESQKLQRIIENLLLLTRFEAGFDDELEPLLLPNIISAAVESFRRRVPGREIALEIEASLPFALGQSTLVSLVLENLLSNADKYSPPETRIELIARANEAGDPEIRVRDNGVGVDPNETETIFTPFYRSPNAKSLAKGMGLGLAVCRRVVEAQNGKIWAEARPEGGSDFVFCLQPVPLAD